jgi:hypothetical protein
VKQLVHIFMKYDIPVFFSENCPNIQVSLNPDSKTSTLHLYLAEFLLE